MRLSIFIYGLKNGGAPYGYFSFLCGRSVLTTNQFTRLVVRTLVLALMRTLSPHYEPIYNLLGPIAGARKDTVLLAAAFANTNDGTESRNLAVNCVVVAS